MNNNENKNNSIINIPKNNRGKLEGIFREEFINFLKVQEAPIHNDVVLDEFRKYLEIRLPKWFLNETIPSRGKELRWITVVRNVISSHPKSIEMIRNNVNVKYENDCYSFKMKEANLENENEPIKMEDEIKLCAFLKIFYGPPGTGKTKKAKEFILEYLPEKDDKDDYNNHCYIVQIHPSYSYEDLIEGIKPVTYSNGDIKYQVVDGPVKIMSKKAKGSPVKLLCMIQGNEIFLPQGAKAKYGFNNVFCSESALTKDQIEEESDDSYIELIQDKFSNNLFKLESTQKSVDELYKLDPSKPYFAELYFWDLGWGPGQGNYALIMDEINRGHVATILGELLFALSEVNSEEGDRKPVQLQYSNEQFEWPNNLSLIGTLNTADTTTDKIDQAIKRRFEFVEVPPLSGEKAWKSAEIKIAGTLIFNFFKDNIRDDDFHPWNLLEKINQCLIENKKRFHLISLKEKLIGHSYFIKYSRIVIAKTEDLIKSKQEAISDKINLDIMDKKIGEIVEQVSNEIYQNEVRPSLLSIFNNSEEQLVEFEKIFVGFKNKTESHSHGDNVKIFEYIHKKVA
ncbi:MAG: hypothetical protein Q7U04_02880 [Bacteriovorax sp.]|nr:hypothetical protein [Bacteriovorax sp.]